jgi:hypothetical protein
MKLFDLSDDIRVIASHHLRLRAQWKSKNFVNIIFGEENDLVLVLKELCLTI